MTRGNYDSADYGSVAQLVERLAVNQNVKGSSPFGIAKGAFLYTFLVPAFDVKEKVQGHACETWSAANRAL